MTERTVGSLFTGVGGLDLGLESAGWTTAWQVEKDLDCTRVLEARWPDVPRFDDVETVHGARACPHGEGGCAYCLSDVHLLCGGFPCQGLSVAGKRKGLRDERSGLFHEFMRVADELRPEWMVIENVPGLLSSAAEGEESGADFRIVMETLEALKYVVDVEILDAQHFGVAQRRRRVFFVCQSVESLLAADGAASGQTLRQAMVECLPAALAGAHVPSGADPAAWAEARALGVERSRRRLDLFGHPLRAALGSLEEIEAAPAWEAAALALRTALDIGNAHASCPRLWSPLASAIGVLEEFEDYARQAAGDLFAPVDGLHAWLPFIEASEAARAALAGLGGGASAEAVLPQREGGGGDPAEGGEAGPGAAAGAEVGAGPGGDGLPALAGSLGTNSTGGHRIDLDSAGAYIPEAAGALTGGSPPGGPSHGKKSGSDRMPMVVEEGLAETGHAVRGTPAGSFKGVDHEDYVPVEVFTGGELPVEVANAVQEREGKGADSNATRPMVVAPDVADTLTAGGHPESSAPGRRREDDANLVGRTFVPEVSVALNAERDGYNDGSDQTYVAEPGPGDRVFKRRGGHGWSEAEGVSPTLEAEGGTHQGGPERVPLVEDVAYALRDERGRDQGDRAIADATYPLHAAKGPSEQQVVGVPGAEPVDLQNTKVGEGDLPDVVGSLNAQVGPNSHGGSGLASAQSVGAGHVIPVEAETSKTSKAYNVHSAGANAKARGAYETDTALSLDTQGRFTPQQGGTVVAEDAAGVVNHAGHDEVIAIQDARDLDKDQNGLGVSGDGTSYTLDSTGAQGVAVPAPFPHLPRNERGGEMEERRLAGARERLDASHPRLPDLEGAEPAGPAAIGFNSWRGQNSDLAPTEEGTPPVTTVGQTAAAIPAARRRGRGRYRGEATVGSEDGAAAYGIRGDAAREGEALTPSEDAEGRVRLRDPGLGISEEVAPTLDAATPHAVASVDPDPVEPTTFDWQAGGHGDTSFRGKSRMFPVRKPGLAGSLQVNKTEAVMIPGGEGPDEAGGPTYSTKMHNTRSNQAGKFYEEYSPGLQADSPPPVVAHDEPRVISETGKGFYTEADTLSALRSQGGGDPRGVVFDPDADPSADPGDDPPEEPSTDALQVDGEEVASTLRGFGHGWQGQHNSTNAVVGFSTSGYGAVESDEQAPTLQASHAELSNQVTGVLVPDDPAIAFTERGREGGQRVEWQEDVAYALTDPAGGGRTNSRMVAAPEPFALRQNMEGEVFASDVSPPVRAGATGGLNQATVAIPGQEAFAFESRVARNGRGAPEAVVPPLKAESGQTGKGDGAPLVAFPSGRLPEQDLMCRCGHLGEWHEDLEGACGFDDGCPCESLDAEPPDDEAMAIRTGGDYADPTVVVDDKAFLAANPMSDRQMAVGPVPGPEGPASLDRRNASLDAEAAHTVQANPHGRPAVLEPIPLQEVNTSRENLRGTGTGVGREGDPMFTLQGQQPHGAAVPGEVDAFYHHSGLDQAFQREVSPPLTKGSGGQGANAPAVGPVEGLAVSENQRAELRLTEHSRQLTTGGGKPGQGYPAVMAREPRRGMSVRRLTPRECERLQAFPDDWTARGGDGRAMSDSARYRQMGNGVCTVVAYWIGRRIDAVIAGGEVDEPDLAAYVAALNADAP